MKNTDRTSPFPAHINFMFNRRKSESRERALQCFWVMRHGGLAKKKKTVGQGYIFSFFIQAFLSVSKHQINVNHVYMCCVHKEQSYMSVFLIHQSPSFFSWHTPYMSVCISVLLGDTVFLEGLVLLLCASQYCSTFSGLSVPPTQPFFLIPLRRVYVHDILTVRSNKISYRQLIK